ncbi:hypothetical protein [Streptomyces sp. NPDC047014]|uniref:hypothetical protein n=1 Tax=Streptomyces sp. NPDC047014 TaxID=3155736 RepID=UPI0033E62334
MELIEIASRMIGILTVCVAEDPEDDAFEERLSDLLQGMHTVELTLPSNTPPADVAQAAVQEFHPRFMVTVGTLLAAYLDLAREHDAGSPERSTQQILQEFALRYRVE